MTLLKKGSTGPAVVDLQRKLTQLGYPLKDDGIFGQGTDDAVRLMQAKFQLDVDGVVGPATLKLLNGTTTSNKGLTESDYKWAADFLATTVAAVKAVREVEAPMGGYLADGRVTILYERHIMYRQLKALGIDPEPYTVTNPDIVNKSTGGYLGKAAEYPRLERAIAINEAAALESCSWGAYQIMGFHWKRLGFTSVKAYTEAMKISERGQLECFVKFIKTDNNLLKAIRSSDWPTFARYYNGSNYQKNKYDTKLAEAFKRFGGK